jgi:hypothetical protein
VQIYIAVANSDPARYETIQRKRAEQKAVFRMIVDVITTVLLSSLRLPDAMYEWGDSLRI